MKTAAVTIDVDSLAHYRAIHGLSAFSDEADPIYTIAMPRFWELIEGAGVPATLFLIGADAPQYAEMFAPVVSSGSEVASHSHHHDYRLIERTPEEIAADLHAADTALIPLNGGRRPVGFRAPGYNVSPALLETVAKLGYSYDSSFLPSPMYYAGRWTMIRAYALAGRASRSLSGNLRQWVGPLAPHRIDPSAPFRPDDKGSLVELPMACEPISRMPLFGTLWTTAAKPVCNAMLRSALSKLDCINFEMHAIDLLDRNDHPALPALAEHQRDLQVPSKEKLQRFKTLFHRLANERDVLTLAEIAART